VTLLIVIGNGNFQSLVIHYSLPSYYLSPLQSSYSVDILLWLTPPDMVCDYCGLYPQGKGWRYESTF